MKQGFLFLWSSFGKPKVFLTFFAIILLSASFNSRLNGLNWRYVFNSDGKGYYAFLPAVFIYGDLAFPFVEEYEKTYYDPGNFSEFRMGAGDHIVNKYWCGVSVMMSPFFFVGLTWAQLSGYEVDGYDYPFQVAIAMGAIFWLLTAVFFLHRCLVKAFQIQTHIASFCLLFFVFGTNLFYYAIFEPSMSHVYSFAAISIWIWTFFRLREKHDATNSLFFGASLGLVGLIRPTNLIILLSLPFLCGGFSPFRSFLIRTLRSGKLLLVMLGGFVLLFGIQPLLFILQTGKPWAYTYGKEGFNFMAPEMMNFLFSFRKGLFIYTPLAFVSLLGFFMMRRNVSLLLFAFLAGVVYLLSSWWMWYYGGSYGMRSAIDFYPFLIILLAGAMKKLPVLFFALCLCCLVYTGIQTYQYTHWILPYDGMNKEKFKTIFLKTGDEYIGKIKAE